MCIRDRLYTDGNHRTQRLQGCRKYRLYRSADRRDADRGNERCPRGHTETYPRQHADPGPYSAAHAEHDPSADTRARCTPVSYTHLGKNCWRTAVQILWATLLITCAIVRKTIFLLPFPLKMSIVENCVFRVFVCPNDSAAPAA